MKLGYIIIDSFDSPGISNKLQYKISALSKEFEEVTCYCFSPSFNEEFVRKAGKEFKFHILKKAEIPSWFHRRFIYRFQYFFSYKNQYDQIYSVIKKSDKDVFLFRYPGADLSLMNLTKKLRNKIIFEHNSIEIDEYRINKGMFLNNYFLRSEKYITPLIHFFSKGLIAVTDEIKNYHVSRAPGKVKACTITNAIAPSAFDIRETVAFDGKNINIISVIGSSIKDWYGLDRFFQAMKSYSGTYRFSLYIVGDLFEKERALAEKMALPNVFFLGKKNSSELKEIYKGMHVGMSALCLFRKNLREACTLKAREYGLLGMPMFYAYKETDFDKCAAPHKFFLQFPNDETPIDLDMIGEFVSRFYADSSNPLRLRKFISEEFNYDKKAAEISKFINSL